MSGLEEKKDKAGPRKLLALDGGGIRGIVSVEILARIEDELRAKLNAGPEFVLADYFDYIAGTSTGAIIATCLSLGMSAADIRTFYVDSGPAMFEKASWYRRFKYKFEDQKLIAKLQEVIASKTGDPLATLASDAIRTYLLLILRNATTDSPWPISNNPAAKYNECTRDDCNLNLPLWQLVRASTAAPTYFPPEVVQVGKQHFIFVDGGVTMYNNPAFQLFLMATLGAYKLGWPAGEDKMLVVSVGTGTAANANANLAPDELNLLYNAQSIPGALMFSASNEQDLLCRVFGNCKSGAMIDREVWDVTGEHGRGVVDPKLFTYMRYNAELTKDGLTALGLPDVKPANVQQLDSIDHIDELQAVGRAVGDRDVKIADFEGFLN
ncbi:MAG TPA: patatin-like phospholipase family protein [Pyrinomonadaceae bacterium]|jgi:patatin-like phospholipase/acyl hydrolase|nr:patatin-like phospholipase family protein [Pyrinomonadaceae bacterium]